jgi:hypothetical protein
MTVGVIVSVHVSDYDAWKAALEIVGSTDVTNLEEA